MDKLFSKKQSYGEFLKFVAPAVFSMIFISLYTIIDGIFVSRFVNSNALAGINIILPVFSLIFAIAIMFATGGSALIAMAMGDGDYKAASSRFSLLLLVTLVIGIVIAVVGVTFNKEIFTILGASDALMDYSMAYGTLIFIGSPIFMVKALFEFFTRTDGAFKLSMIASIIGGVINIIFDYIFIVLFGWGIAGAALATLLGALVGLIICAVYFLTKHATLRYVLPKFELSVITSSALNGSSEMLTELSTGITTLLFNALAMKYAGEHGVAAITIVLYAQFLMISTYLGFVSGVGPMFSYNLGAQNTAKIKEAHAYSKRFIAYSSVIVFAFCVVFGSVIVRAFVGPDDPVYPIALTGLRTFSLSFLIIGFNIYVSGMFTAFGNGKLSAIVSFARALCFVFIGFMFLPSLFGLTGLWLVVPFAEGVTLFVSYYLLKKHKTTYHY